MMIPPRLDPARRCLPVCEWPVLDQTLWAKAQLPANVLDDPGPASSWRQPTRQARETAYGRWLGFLLRCGELDSVARPEERVTPERVAAYVEHLRAMTASTSTWSMVSRLDAMMRALAPAADWTWLREAANRLKRLMRPARAIRPRLIGVSRLFHAGLKMMKDARQSTTGRRPVWRLTRYRDGLMLAFRAAFALRLKNLTMVVVGEHVVRLSDGFVVRFTGDEVKNGRPFERHAPALLVPYIATSISRRSVRRCCRAAHLRLSGSPSTARRCRRTRSTRG
jgi:hypothetical protein